MQGGPLLAALLLAAGWEDTEQLVRNSRVSIQGLVAQQDAIVVQQILVVAIVPQVGCCVVEIHLQSSLLHQHMQDWMFMSHKASSVQNGFCLPILCPSLARQMSRMIVSVKANPDLGQPLANLAEPLPFAYAYQTTTQSRLLLGNASLNS